MDTRVGNANLDGRRRVLDAYLVEQGINADASGSNGEIRGLGRTRSRARLTADTESLIRLRFPAASSGAGDFLKAGGVRPEEEDPSSQPGAGATSMAQAEEAMPQQLPEQAPNGSEPLAFSADVDAAIAQGARTVRFGDALAARGRTAVALDDAGRLTLYHPDGTTSLLP